MLSEQEIEMIQQIRRRERRFSPERRTLRAGIPQDTREHTLATMRWPENIAPMADAMTSFVKEFTDGAWLGSQPPLLTGPAGIGKTLLWGMAAREISDRNFLVRYVSFSDYVATIVRRAELENEAKRGSVAAGDDLEAMTNEKFVLENAAHLLILDDVGREHRTSTGYVTNQLDLLLRGRRARMLPTGIASHVHIDDWASFYGPSVHSLVQRTCQVLAPTPKQSPDDAADRQRFLR